MDTPANIPVTLHVTEAQMNYLAQRAEQHKMGIPAYMVNLLKQDAPNAPTPEQAAQQAAPQQEYKSTVTENSTALVPSKGRFAWLKYVLLGLLVAALAWLWYKGYIQQILKAFRPTNMDIIPA